MCWQHNWGHLETHYSFGLLDMFMSEEELAVEIAKIDRV
jgi:hypothetical protein